MSKDTIKNQMQKAGIKIKLTYKLLLKLKQESQLGIVKKTKPKKQGNKINNELKIEIKPEIICKNKYGFIIKHRPTPVKPKCYHLTFNIWA